jgi:trehalose 6-phosphate synthase/phosphatase
MMHKGRLIVASVRLPVTVSRRQDSWDVAPSTGGLVTALNAVGERRPFTWLGWPGAHVPEEDRAEVTEALARHGAHPVYISKGHVEGFYQSFSNGVLWPLFHNLAERSRFDLSGYKSYEVVNEMFADAICERARPGDAVWVHDYQLALVPALLRRRGLHCPIGFFLHIPFPSAETYRTLPVREVILQGMLGADLLGFHAYEYVNHFRSACLRVLGIESDIDAVRVGSRRVNLAVLPIGIDPNEVRAMAQGRAARQELASLQSAYIGKKVIVGVDRLDYTKGIPEKLLGFEEVLKNYPKWRQRVVLIQIAAPSRTGVEEYKRLKRDVDELVGRINGRYGSPSAMPVVYVNQNVSRERLVGLYQAAEVALVTPVRDGMNLVALEYVAARGDLGGTLILSEFAGAAHWLPGARLVNPYNTADMASAIVESLELSRPDMDAFQHMSKFVNENTSMLWANRFLDRLEASVSDLAPVTELFAVQRPQIAERFARAERPLILLDYDGTLRSFVIDPRDAAPDARIRAVLRDLSAYARVYVVSGRSADVLESWLGELPIGLVCEHGLSIRNWKEDWQAPVVVSGSALRRLVEPLFRNFVQRTPGSSIEYKEAAIAWHYRAADPEFGTLQANELLPLLEDTLHRKPYNVLRGNRVLEVRHQKVSKGQALLQILKQYADTDLLFCAGDDRTDEDMLDAIPLAYKERSMSCWVGTRHARADYWVESSQALLTELEAVVRLWRGRDKRSPPREDGRSLPLATAAAAAARLRH